LNMKAGKIQRHLGTTGDDPREASCLFPWLWV
jgi:hypothetical protein